MTDNRRYLVSRNKREGFYAGTLYKFCDDGSWKTNTRTKIRKLSLKSKLMNYKRTAS